MAGYRVNMADVESKSFDAVPAGTYVCYITGAEERVTSDDSPKIPGEPYLRFEFTVAQGEYENRKFWGNGYLEESSGLRWTLKSLLVATGLFTEEQFDAGDIAFRIEEEDGDETDGPALVGTLLKVKVDRKKSDYNGEFQNNVRGYRPVSDEEADALSLMP